MEQLYLFDIPSDKRLCHSCQQLLPPDRFYTHERRNFCILCLNEKQRARAAKKRGLDEVPPPRYINPDGKRRCRVCKQMFDLDEQHFPCDRNPGQGKQEFRYECIDCYRAKRQAKADAQRGDKPKQIRNPEGKRRCRVCKQVFDLNAQNFFQSSRNAKGFKYECKTCTAEYKRLPHVQERNRLYSRQHRPSREVMRAYNHKYYSRYHEQRLAQRHIRRAGDPIWAEQDRDRSRQYYREHPEYWITSTARRRGIATFDGGLSRVQLRQICERDTVCYICDKEIGLHRTELDHVIPLARGGPHEFSNLRLVHKVCNRRKHARLISEMTPFQRRGP